MLANCVDRRHIKQCHHKRWLHKTQYSLARPRDTHSSYNNPPQNSCLPLWLFSFRVPRSVPRALCSFSLAHLDRLPPRRECLKSYAPGCVCVSTHRAGKDAPTHQSDQQEVLA